MAVELRDLLYLALGAVGLFLLARASRGRPALMDRSSQDALVAQLIQVTQERDACAHRAEEAERRATQLQGMVDNLLPARVNDQQVIEAQRRQLQERAQELDGLKTGLGLR